MPFDPTSYQNDLQQKDNAKYAEFHVDYRLQDIERLKDDIDQLTQQLNTAIGREKKDIETRIAKKKAEIKQIKQDIKGIPYISKPISYILNRFGFVQNNAEPEAVWEAHHQVLTNYVKPLHESLERIPFPHFLKKVGLTDALLPEILSKRLFHVVRRMTKSGEYKFPIHDVTHEKQAFETLNKAIMNWVSEVLGSQAFSSELPSWTEPRFQIYLGYEALYTYLDSINVDLPAKIEHYDFYEGIRCWLYHAHPRGEGKPTTIELSECQWTQVLDKALANPISYLALFSKAVHLLLFVGNANKAEEADTQNPSNRQLFLNTLDDEITHLEPEDDKEVLKKVLEGKKAFEGYANQAKPEELGRTISGIIPQPWCKSSLCRFLGLAYCQNIYDIAQQVFSEKKELPTKSLPKTVRDILVKPLSRDTKEHNNILALLEGGRNANQVVDDIMTLVDNATFPVFRDIWEILDNQEIIYDD